MNDAPEWFTQIHTAPPIGSRVKIHLSGECLAHIANAVRNKVPFPREVHGMYGRVVSLTEADKKTSMYKAGHTVKVVTDRKTSAKLGQWGGGLFAPCELEVMKDSPATKEWEYIPIKPEVGLEYIGVDWAFESDRSILFPFRSRGGLWLPDLPSQNDRKSRSAWSS